MLDTQRYELKARLIRFEGKLAILKTEDGQELRWMIKDLPDDIKEGSFVRLVLSTEKTELQEREKLAKAMLNQILKGV